MFTTLNNSHFPISNKNVVNYSLQFRAPNIVIGATQSSVFCITSGKEPHRESDFMKYPEGINKKIRNLEDAGYILPASLAAIIIFLAIILDVLFGNQLIGGNRLLLIVIGIGGSLYVIIQILLIAPRIRNQRKMNIWVNAGISGLGFSVFAFVLGETYYIFYSVLLILAVSANSILSDRGPTYFLIIFSGASFIYSRFEYPTNFIDWTILFIPSLAAFVVTETILRLRRATHNHILRLESINVLSQQIISSLETEQVLTIINAAIQKTLTADTYFVGLLEGDFIRLELFYDDGEYFNGVRIPKSGSLSAWVIENRKPLFVPDLRDEVQLEGVQSIRIGKDKPSLSWMGVPIKTANINGLLAVGSNKVNAFSTTDYELLLFLAQHAALALDNTVHHKLVQKQSQLDSLTGTFNHRHFLKVLQSYIDESPITADSKLNHVGY